VDWRPFSTGAFSLARRVGKPILLLVGAHWSAVGRTADVDAFQDRDVQALLARNFICIRLDIQEKPSWSSAFLPLQRPQPNDPGFQMYFLDPTGKLFMDGGSIGLQPPMNAPEMTRLLMTAVDRYDAIARSVEGLPDEAERQKRQVELLMAAPTTNWPNFIFHDQQVKALGNLKRGGFPVRDFSQLRPHAFRWLLNTGQRDSFDKLMKPLFKGGHIDLLGGGFFDQYLVSPPRTIEYDKLAIANSEMAHVLAAASAAYDDPLYKELALRTATMLATDMVARGHVAAAELDNAIGRGRSRRSSISVRELRENLTEEERGWARTKLGLRVEDNPSMTMRLNDPAVLSTEQKKFEQIVRKLTASRSADHPLSGFAQAHVAGIVTARLIQVAAVTDDSNAWEYANTLWSQLEPFLAGDDVRRSLLIDVDQTPFLTDYLGFADAALQNFLATGNQSALERGFRVLKRATFLFGSDVPGVWYLTPKPSPEPGPQNVRVPEVMDFTRESATAMMIRLCNNYGRLLRNMKAPWVAPGDPALFCQYAMTTTSKFADLSQYLAFFGSAYFCSSFSVLDEKHAFVVGKDSLKQSIELRRRFPGKLIAPVLGGIRPDLLTKGDGVYVVAGGETMGPMSVSDATAKLAESVSLP
jgi:uncharacterized protein YyaL (SSP411 family)